MHNRGYSNHAVEQFQARFPELMVPGVHPKVCLHRAFQGASEEAGFMNDTRRIVWMLEKYNDFNFQYFVKDNMVFVTSPDTVITVITRSDMGMQRMLKEGTSHRYRKKAVAR